MHAVPLEAVPAGHGVHCEALPALMEPDAQAVHATAEADEKVPAGQMTCVAVVLPAGQK